MNDADTIPTDIASTDTTSTHRAAPAPGRGLVSVMQVSLDGHILDADGGSGWVESWADGLDLLGPVDAFLLGGGMFGGYEEFWGTILDDPTTVAGWLGRDLFDRELAYAERAARTPHLVLSSTVTGTSFPSARILGGIDEVAQLRRQAEAAVYVVGGPGLVRSLLDAGLLDELHLLVHPVVVGSGTPLFAGLQRHHDLDLAGSATLAGGRVHLSYVTGNRR